MEGTMEQFTEKLAGLVELGKKNKNFLEYAQIDSYFKDMKLNSDMMEAIYDYLEQNGFSTVDDLHYTNDTYRAIHDYTVSAISEMENPQFTLLR